MNYVFQLILSTTIVVIAFVVHSIKKSRAVSRPKFPLILTPGYQPNTDYFTRRVEELLKKAKDIFEKVTTSEQYAL